jgi:hypothetical protein
MKTSRGTHVPEAHPRLVCQIVRQWSVVSDGRTPGHVARCADCQAYFAATRELQSALREDAAKVRRSAETTSPAFEPQLRRAIRNAAPEPANARPTMLRRAWGIGGLCAAAALAVALSLRTDPGSQPEPLASASAREDAAVIITAVESLSSDLVESVIPKAGELVAQNPLQQEFGSVYSDVRSALDFLALNFLPTTPANPEPASTRRI